MRSNGVTGLLRWALGVAASLLVMAQHASAQTIAVTATILPEVRLTADPVVMLSPSGLTTAGRATGGPGVMTRLVVPQELWEQLGPGSGWKQAAGRAVPSSVSVQVAPGSGEPGAVRRSYVVTWLVVPKS